MKKLGAIVLALGMSVIIGLPLLAQDAKEKKGKKKKGENAAVAQAFAFLSSIELTDEQKTKLEAIKTECSPKIVELGKKRADILTKEQMDIQKKIRAEGKSAGKKKKEVEQEVQDAMKMTDEQRTKLQEVNKEAAELTAQIREKVGAILTDEQKAKLQPQKRKKKNA